ncbi:glycosyltransferase family 2 protein [Floridanema evergladense]|uniref:Glycosyltransferase family 2 protein n=1 Tax=Floridaenema evergladense BLCC-F167 TaxID=3153639 RepID=A0ABV4WJX1_9CYAN
MFGVTVNHFYKENYPPFVKQSTKFAASLLKNCPEVTTVIVIDGSATEDEELRNYCESIGINYLHGGKILSFAEAYNLGVSQLTESWVVTMASDIYVYPTTFTTFREFIETHKDKEIGCLIPYLSRCDFPVQRTTQNQQRYSCYSPIMSLNMNVFPKDVYEKSGGISTNYTGNFNDVDLTLKLQKMGLNIFLVDNYVQHYGRLTLRHGTNVDAHSDWKIFYADYPELKGNSELWSLRLDKFLRHPILKLVFRIAMKVKNKELRNKLHNWVYDMIPVLQKV